MEPPTAWPNFKHLKHIAPAVAMGCEVARDSTSVCPSRGALRRRRHGPLAEGLFPARSLLDRRDPRQGLIQGRFSRSARSLVRPVAALFSRRRARLITGTRISSIWIIT